MIELKDIRKAAATLQEYKRGKANLERRIIDNEQWFKMRHWQQYRRDDGGKLPSSGWLFNSIINKHADAMDNYPQPAILPREESDTETAKQLSEVVPAILDHCNYEQVFSDAWWYKLKNGTSIKGVFWNSCADDITVTNIDILNVFWEPGITDFQQSENLFHVALLNNEDLEQVYPDLKLIQSGPSIDVSQYIYDESIDTSKKSAVVDWYYKKANPQGKPVLHYCKFVGENILFASENEKRYAETGYYSHGLYPFVADILYKEEGMPVGIGLIDVMKDAQESIDELDSNIQFNARLLAKPRFLAKTGSGVNLKELGDYNNSFVEVTGDPTTAVFPLPTQSLDASIINYRALKIEELKEISGNRDFNQGSTAGGVTAASAIAQLQEAGNKLSRDAIRASYRAFSKEIELVIELIRQFYDETRVFRITEPNGSYRFVKFNNANMQLQEQGEIMGVELGERLPVYDIKVSAQKQSPFNQISHNQFIFELFSSGAFNPQIAEQTLTAVSMMEFEGKDKLVEKLTQTINMQNQMAALQAQIQLENATGTGLTDSNNIREEGITVDDDQLY